MMKYRHWFWDFDGTLFNTYPRICRAFQKSLADAGIFEETADILPRLKQSLETATKAYGTRFNVPPEVLLAGYHRHSEEEGLETMQPYPGMKAFLQLVIDQGGFNYLYTHRGESLFKALKNEDIEGCFIDIVTSLDGFPGKPAPDALLFMMNKHGLNPMECVMVGDRTIDLYAGLNAGMNAICLDPDGFCPPVDGVPVYHSYKDITGAFEE